MECLGDVSDRMLFELDKWSELCKDLRGKHVRYVCEHVQELHGVLGNYKANVALN